MELVGLPVVQNETLDSSWSSSNLVQFSEDDLVNSWMLTSSPWPVVILVVVYLAFGLYFGPRLMKTKKPCDLRAVMKAYNLLQVFYNSSLVVTITSTEGISYIIKHHCDPLDIRTNPLRITLFNLMWHYTVLKIMDLLDTVFLVLRKKKTSFLHVYHHTSMVLLSFGALKYMRGEQVVWVGIVNTIVHVFMYSYYFLAAFGDRVRSYLWWKQYITVLQMAQFTGFLIYYLYLMMTSCNAPKLLTFIASVQAFVFLCLFAEFYKNSYAKNSSGLGYRRKDQ